MKNGRERKERVQKGEAETERGNEERRRGAADFSHLDSADDGLGSVLGDDLGVVEHEELLGRVLASVEVEGLGSTWEERKVVSRLQRIEEV